MNTLAGKTALVTGASRGIGAAIALRLAQEGADVAITYASSEDKAAEVVAAIQALGRRGRAYRIDSGDADALRAGIDRVAADLGGLDILVNNAGVLIAGNVEGFALEDFDRTMAVNLRAVFVATQAAVRHMDRGGRIVNLGSCLAQRAGRAGIAVYAASKSALGGLTRGFARDLGERGITVNLVHPGPTDTDMNPADGPRADALRAMMPIPRYGEGANIASLVAWIAGEEGRYANGAEFAVDGGINA
ncbi:3-oxoacyl-ACP reductase family protein [Luteimonas aquatica]|uniref:3-oxoacyl-ACP reductase family protein n=1 Tax=Luteimonas aquatica TaxID=450364 RepID=UPI001F576595|nr:3-oxoacyl-ACP reductase family protein [Luteimonas aquatica]